MDKLYLTVGQMAELNHVSAQTLRLYDREGLLKPEFLDEKNGYRYYHISQCAQLDMIQTMKTCGMTLRQIEKQFRNSSLEEMHELLLEQDRLLEEKMLKLAQSRKSIRRLCDNIGQLKALPPIGEIFLEYVPERRIDTLRTEYDYFTEGYAGYERMLRSMKGYMLRQNLPLSYFLNAGTLIEQKDFAKGNFVAHTVFIFVDEEYPAVKSIRELSGGTVMAICADDPDKELEYAEKLYRSISQNGYETAGDYLCEVISEFPVLANRGRREMIYKIQVPVRKKAASCEE